ncbi:BA75_02397T0 [Komagataella pastoris]|uniref:Endoplasmic reticulum junction formation protein lunapark n=1 Tax=Komagataella pastoris TaxID=4922 RepID=A0A1B2JDW2_PICPA|nr:BA75_02397T0 [Komagataella pastoris]
MAWLPFLHGSSDRFSADKFERELKAISTKILKNERKSIRYKRQFKQWRASILFYISILYTVLVAYEVIFVSHGRQMYIHLVGIPIGVLLCDLLYKKIFNIMMKRIEANLVDLRTQHQEKIENLKDLSNFNETTSLLKRFTDGEDLEALEKEQAEAARKQQEYFKLLETPPPVLSGAATSSLRPSSVFEPIMKLLLGEDEMSPNNRYALICTLCHQNNGLAPPGEVPKEVKYICIHCGYLNAPEKDQFPDVDSTDNDTKRIGDQVQLGISKIGDERRKEKNKET